jgi:hypothetical protein
MTLLDMAGLPCSMTDTSSISTKIDISRTQRAAFWIFARQDCISAYITNRPPRIHANNIAIWQSLGVNLTADGSIDLAAVTCRLESATDSAAEQDLSHLLVYLLTRVINFHIGLHQDGSQSQPILQAYQMEHCDALLQDLDRWYSLLPPQFLPYLRMPPTQITPHATFITPTAFVKPICTTAMIYYHFAKMLLLAFSPLSSSPSLELSSRPMQVELPEIDQMTYHIREICGIAAAYPAKEVQVHLVQPLYQAGLCSNDRGLRHSIISLLREIEREAGWPANFRIQGLEKEWARKDLGQ